MNNFEYQQELFLCVCSAEVGMVLVVLEYHHLAATVAPAAGESWGNVDSTLQYDYFLKDYFSLKLVMCRICYA